MSDFKPDLTTEADGARTLSRGLAKGRDSIDRTGGKHEAGVIYGAAVITTGVEALGHRSWIDEEFGESVAKAIFDSGSRGFKGRFTHPGLSSDGLGKYLGRWHATEDATSWRDLIDGDVVRADLHFGKAAHNSPDGDLADYVMDLGEEDPESFGTSIVFKRDFGAEEEFRGKHSDDEGRFKSPDKRNKKNYKHARLSELFAVDAVDDPAANPKGLFHRQHEAHHAEALAEFAFGLSDELPEDSAAAFSVHPKRVSTFVSKFLDERGLQVVPKQPPEESMSKENEQGTEKPAEVTQASQATEPPNAEADIRKQLSRYMDTFGAEQGAKWFNEGKPWDDCVQAQLTAQQEEIAELKGKLSTVQLGQKEEVSGGTAEEPKPEDGQRSKLKTSLGAKLGGYANSLKMPGSRSERN